MLLGCLLVAISPPVVLSQWLLGSSSSSSCWFQWLGTVSRCHHMWESKSRFLQVPKDTLNHKGRTERQTDLNPPLSTVLHLWPTLTTLYTVRMWLVGLLCHIRKNREYWNCPWLPWTILATINYFRTLFPNSMFLFIWTGVEWPCHQAYFLPSQENTYTACLVQFLIAMVTHTTSYY